LENGDQVIFVFDLYRQDSVWMNGIKQKNIHKLFTGSKPLKYKNFLEL